MSTGLKLVYITSDAHSGSTLLDLLISSHDQVVSVGEVHQFEKNPDQRCSCGAPDARSCPFWLQVNTDLMAATGKSLRDIGMREDVDGLFAVQQRALFQAVQRVSGANVVVDSSKNPARLSLLLHSPGIEVYPIHLIRKPQGVVYSNVKKGRPWLTRAGGYATQMVKTKEVLRDHEHLVVRYEDLATRTSEVLERVMHWVGLEFDRAQLEWAGRERHNYEGNRIRRSSDSTIRLDEDWKQGLSSFQIAAIGLIARTGGSRPVWSGLKYVHKRLGALRGGGI